MTIFAVLYADPMGKTVQQWSFTVSVTFCLVPLWTIAYGEQSLVPATAVETISPRWQQAQAETDQPATGDASGQAAITVQTAADGMLIVPAGAFTMGCQDTEDNECEEDEKPQRQVTVAAFQIDRTEVTVSQYRQCVDAKRCTVPDSAKGACNWGISERDNHPINCIDWNQAVAVCTWAGKRLPTSEEWEKAARGTDARVYPSGEAWDIAKANVYESYDGYKETAPVGSFPAGVSPYGVLDMAGNVWEWTSDWYREGQTRLIRGGSWLDLPRRARTTRRLGTPPISRNDDIGVRCAR